jgi:hypothetical protein
MIFEMITSTTPTMPLPIAPASPIPANRNSVRNYWQCRELWVSLERRVMKINALVEGVVVGVVAAVLSYYLSISQATIAALSIRRKMPDAWFSGLIVWYATFLVIGLSIVIAAVVFRLVYKHAASANKSS